jgi:hypothetical protein
MNHTLLSLLCLSDNFASYLYIDFRHLTSLLKRSISHRLELLYRPLRRHPRKTGIKLS